jgi:hypothetical protein
MARSPELVGLTACSTLVGVDRVRRGDGLCGDLVSSARVMWQTWQRWAAAEGRLPRVLADGRLTGRRQTASPDLRCRTSEL